ncbi:MAG: inositol monophosphatase [Patescibacteria group bacterium]|nr:inositol monophosphatase [Patescibacteria group bacterium]
MSKEAEFLEKIAREAGAITLKHFKRAKVEYTKGHDLNVVTKADLESNEYLVSEIRKKFPDDGFISEEKGEDNSEAERIWIIDPLDGTLNFSKGIPMYSVMIARARKGIVELAAIYDPVHDDLYMAEKGKGAYLNGERAHCSEATELHASVGGFNVSYRQRNVEVLKKLLAASPQEKIYSVAYYAIGTIAAHVSAGKRDWMLSYGAQVWDYAAPSLLLAESGCKVTTDDGQEWTLKDKVMLAANPKLHAKLLKALKA